MSRQPVTLADLLSLREGGVIEDFGPGSPRPWLAIDFRANSAVDAEDLGAWLTTLPCPVIGVADADTQAEALSACDATVAHPEDLAAIAATVEAAPIAAMTFVQVLRIIEHLPPEAALTAESMAYGVLQTGPEFNRWLATQDEPAPSVGSGAAVEIDRQDGTLRITLNRPHDRNALTGEMRSALVEAFDLAALDDSITGVTLEGAGKCFSVGGDLTEFGLAPDPASAHWVRSIRSPARSALRCAAKLRAHAQGACIGAGVELPAFASRFTATASCHFQLPELKMGLLPGSGGCVSLSRRIGRQKTALMGLTGRRINAAQALKWGLIDEVVD